MAELSREFLAVLKKVTGKRSRAVIDHILKHGYVTTGELKDIYGYNHAARAPRDVREEGIPLETFFLKGADGRRMAGYKFADLSKIESHKLGGRKTFSKKFKIVLYTKQGGRCGICDQTYEIRYLQVDHRIPYQVAGDQIEKEADQSAFMLICGSCQRSKSWSCEHCGNWLEQKDTRVCVSCYWADPISYAHVAMQQQRRADVVWAGGEVKEFEKLRREARKNRKSVPDQIKTIIRER